MNVKRIDLGSSDLPNREENDLEKMELINSIFENKPYQAEMIKPRPIRKKGVFVRRVKKRKPEMGFFE